MLKSNTDTILEFFSQFEPESKPEPCSDPEGYEYPMCAYKYYNPYDLKTDSEGENKDSESESESESEEEDDICRTRSCLRLSDTLFPTIPTYAEYKCADL